MRLPFTSPTEAESLLQELSHARADYREQQAKLEYATAMSQMLVVRIERLNRMITSLETEK